ncbi:hypothetical protein KPSA3_01456 [Pseudomonas syringae pv. actinidiae]|uniref:Uncharacterized protein n=1 Tax=Pseudomonas syringae pv. actinidiae TaxID=103796 RepID=A0AAN4TJA8_PSESF|nr:hypothetical protein KPSA3_01456 [Pseudomonas syringae pv. actinidiae]
MKNCACPDTRTPDAQRMGGMHKPSALIQTI